MFPPSANCNILRIRRVAGGRRKPGGQIIFHDTVFSLHINHTAGNVTRRRRMRRKPQRRHSVIECHNLNWSVSNSKAIIIAVVSLGHRWCRQTEALNRPHSISWQSGFPAFWPEFRPEGRRHRILFVWILQPKPNHLRTVIPSFVMHTYPETLRENNSSQVLNFFLFLKISERLGTKLKVMWLLL